jgi:glutathione S-transferase
MPLRCLSQCRCAALRWLLCSAAEAAERAAVRLFVSQLDFAPMYRFLLEQDRSRDAAHADACAAALADIESLYGAQSPDKGPFFLGERISAADIALLPFIARLGPALKAFRGYHLCDVHHSGCNAVLPRICAALRAMQARPSWQHTACEPSFYVSALEGYAAGRPGVPRRVRAQSPDAAAFAAVPPAGA